MPARMPTLGSAVTSYVIAHPGPEEREGELDSLRAYLRHKKMDVPKDRLRGLVKREVRKLESVEAWAEEEIALFSKEERARPANRRHGKPFCPKCGMFKDHSKECPYCGHLELTI